MAKLDYKGFDIDKRYINTSLKDDEIYNYYGKVIKKEDAIYVKYLHSHLHKDDKNLVIDAISKEYTYLRDCLEIRVSFKPDGTPNGIGYTMVHKYALIYLKGTWYKALYEAIPLDMYTENLHDGRFYHNDTSPEKIGKQQVIYRKVKNSLSSPKGDLKNDYLMGVKSPTYKITEGKKYKFGLEFETIYGRLPEYLDNYLNYNAVHDGSLRGPDGEDPLGGEYVTGVLTGDMGFLQTKRLTYELTRRCKIDKRCGEMLATL